MKYTICVDFDGVIHDMQGPFIAADVIKGEPIPGALEWLTEMSQKFNVVINTARLWDFDMDEPRQAYERSSVLTAMMDWLSLHGMDHTLIHKFIGKPPALIYIDDRAVRYEGGAFPTADEIHKLKPWNR